MEDGFVAYSCVAPCYDGDLVLRRGCNEAYFARQVRNVLGIERRGLLKEHVLIGVWRQSLPIKIVGNKVSCSPSR